MNGKSQGLSINTIIIAAIALIVLVVLIAIFTGRLGLFSKGLSGTVTCEGSCKAVNMQFGLRDTVDGCKTAIGNRKYIPGEFQDLQPNTVCCCQQ
ncbi:hypothetical protein HYU09_03260 [Candidatus Woesearchaeota archaeon]|nr:hypothetical protein [Candidatus Woesearchaeota archaeon]